MTAAAPLGGPGAQPGSPWRRWTTSPLLQHPGFPARPRGPQGQPAGAGRSLRTHCQDCVPYALLSPPLSGHGGQGRSGVAVHRGGRRSSEPSTAPSAPLLLGAAPPSALAAASAWGRARLPHARWRRGSAEGGGGRRGAGPRPPSLGNGFLQIGATGRSRRGARAQAATALRAPRAAQETPKGGLCVRVS